MEIINADCLVAMAGMDDCSVDAVVTDPPYGLAFMGVAWDTFGDGRKGGSRTNATFGQVGGNHHPTCAADQARTRKSENIKFQERMTPVFEEALRVAKPGAHLLCFGGTRTFHRMACAIEDAGWEIRDTVMWVYGSGFPHGMDASKAIEKKFGAERKVVGEHPNPAGNKQGGNSLNLSKVGMPDKAYITEPATDLALQWEGWNTALKPAWEPIIMARKPLDGTVAHNVLTWGVGALNIDACRVPTESGDKGRFPANLVHDGSQMVLDLFPDTGKSSGGGGGSAARFFYCAKASKKDRGDGNDHPTVKPTALMEWLIKLVVPEGGTVLDPFMGSGSTGVACERLRRRFVGIEKDAHYCEIAERRLAEARDGNA